MQSSICAGLAVTLLDEAGQNCKHSYAVKEQQDQCKVAERNAHFAYVLHDLHAPQAVGAHVCNFAVCKLSDTGHGLMQFKMVLQTRPCKPVKVQLRCFQPGTTNAAEQALLPAHLALQLQWRDMYGNIVDLEPDQMKSLAPDISIEPDPGMVIGAQMGGPPGPSSLKDNGNLPAAAYLEHADFRCNFTDLICM